ncbi:MAG: DegV family EDD domain-containing protein [Mycoplasmataceae bacterium]|nr:DegV family EDD domain-containing protein [Mycoplasmataceae bacterium]
MKKACLVFDSSANARNGEYDDVFVLPLQIILKKKNETITYKDGVDITIDEIERNENAGLIYSTSAANPNDIINLFEKITKQYEKVYILPIPETISPGGVNVVNLVTQEYDNVVLIKQYMVSIMTKWEIIDLIKLLKEDKLNEESIQKVVNHYYYDTAAALITPDLSFLVRGGRIKKVTGAIANFLKIIPINSFDREGVTSRSKVVNLKKIPEAIEKYYSTFLDNFDWNNVERFAILSSKNRNDKFKTDEIIDLVSSTLLKKLPPNIKIDKETAPAVITCHTGPSYAAFAVLIKESKRK